MFVLKIWMICAIWCTGTFSDGNKETVGYFADQTTCNIHGMHITEKEKFLIWECEPDEH